MDKGRCRNRPAISYPRVDSTGSNIYSKYILPSQRHCQIYRGDPGPTSPLSGHSPRPLLLLGSPPRHHRLTPVYVHLIYRRVICDLLGHRSAEGMFPLLAGGAIATGVCLTAGLFRPVAPFGADLPFPFLLLGIGIQKSLEKSIVRSIFYTELPKIEEFFTRFFTVCTRLAPKQF